jgi:hypothetical protein
MLAKGGITIVFYGFIKQHRELGDLNMYTLKYRGGCSTSMSVCGRITKKPRINGGFSSKVRNLSSKKLNVFVKPRGRVYFYTERRDLTNQVL